VAGSAELMQAFEAARLDVLTQAVRREQLRTDIRDMRERMRRELSRAGAGEFDLKQDRGGLADIEFLAQYWVLKHAADYPPLTTFPDTIRMLESVGSAALVDHGVIDRLIDTYRDYRAVLHRRTLEGHTRVVPAGDHAPTAAWVGAIWEAVMVQDTEPAHDGPSV